MQASRRGGRAPFLMREADFHRPFLSGIQPDSRIYRTLFHRYRAGMVAGICRPAGRYVHREAHLARRREVFDINREIARTGHVERGSAFGLDLQSAVVLGGPHAEMYRTLRLEYRLRFIDRLHGRRGERERLRHQYLPYQRY